jgi:hypothetical protein
MVFIPLGTKCMVRMSIDKFTGTTRETNLFDWNITNFGTIVHYLKNIDKEIVYDDFINMDVVFQGIRLLKHKDIKLVSVHDLPENLSYFEGMLGFLDKYNRRRLRLKNLIQTQENIHFIHFIDIEENNMYIPSVAELMSFYDSVKSIKGFSTVSNPSIHFIVHPDFYNLPNWPEKKVLLDMIEFPPHIHVHYLKRLGFPLSHENKSGEGWNWNEVYASIMFKYPNCF